MDWKLTLAATTHYYLSAVHFTNCHFKTFDLITNESLCLCQLKWPYSSMDYPSNDLWSYRLFFTLLCDGEDALGLK